MRPRRAFTQVPEWIFETPYANEPRKFTKLEALLDLAHDAAYIDHPALVNGHVVDLRVGDIPHSIRFLERRWRWPHQTTQRFIKQLIAHGYLCSKVVGTPSGKVSVFHLCKTAA